MPWDVHLSGQRTMPAIDQRNGFTLIELLVGAVVASVTVVAGPKLQKLL